MPVAASWMKFNIPILLAKTAIIDTIAIRALVLLERYYFSHRELPKTDQDRAVLVNRRGQSSRPSDAASSTLNEEVHNLTQASKKIERIWSSR